MPNTEPFLHGNKVSEGEIISLVLSSSFNWANTASLHVLVSAHSLILYQAHYMRSSWNSYLTFISRLRNIHPQPFLSNDICKSIGNPLKTSSCQTDNSVVLCCKKNPSNYVHFRSTVKQKQRAMQSSWVLLPVDVTKAQKSFYHLPLLTFN